MMKLVAPLAAVLALALAPPAMAAAPAKGIKLPGRNGVVTFNHSSHARLKCTSCHKSEKGGPIDGFGKTMNKDKAHGACHECHRKEGKGPQKCADCHKK